MYFLIYCSKLGIAANRKNTDQHIILFSWLLEVVAVDIDRDKWLPRIELQGLSSFITIWKLY